MIKLIWFFFENGVGSGPNGLREDATEADRDTARTVNSSFLSDLRSNGTEGPKDGRTDTDSGGNLRVYLLYRDALEDGRAAACLTVRPSVICNALARRRRSGVSVKLANPKVHCMKFGSYFCSVKATWGGKQVGRYLCGYCIFWACLGGMQPVGEQKLL